MAISEFTAALNQVASERNISADDVIDTLKDALIAAYRKDHPVDDEDYEKFDVDVESESGEIKIMFDGEDVTPAGFGRIASQTAKQVILQKIREAEKESIANEYKALIGTIVQGYIFRVDKETVIMDLGKTQGILPPSEQIGNEDYSVNQRYKVLVKDVAQGDGGSNIILSRKDPQFIEELFKQEVPEMNQGVVKIESIARESGERTKIAVSSTDSKVDPSGACIGQRGIRVQAVTDELGGEKIDIINYSPDADKFIAASLAPAHVIDVVIDRETESAKVKVSEDQQSLAIGNKGQNARLAAKLTGWRITIDGSEVDVSPEDVSPQDEEESVDAETNVEIEGSESVEADVADEVDETKETKVEVTEEAEKADADDAENAEDKEEDATEETEEKTKTDKPKS